MCVGRPSESTTVNWPCTYLLSSACLIPICHTLSGKSDVQSLGLGPNVVAPPRSIGDEMEPIRAMPEPFCGLNFLFDPRISDRVFVDAVPALWAFISNTTHLCRISLRIDREGSNIDGESSRRSTGSEVRNDCLKISGVRAGNGIARIIGAV